MVKRSAELDQSLSNASLAQENRHFETPVSPVTHWAKIYVDYNGNIRVISNLPTNVFTPREYQNIREAVQLATQRDLQSVTPNSSALNVSPIKRRRDNEREEPLAVDCIESFEDVAGLEIGNTNEVTAYYTSVFKRLQQGNCQMLAKGFIKLIEPRKQVKHPYNGGRGSAPGKKGDPELTKPDWWPRDVSHKEPDHLRQESRVKLLVHIIQQLLPIGITADRLQQVANDIRRQIKPPEKVEILDELFRVRRLEEKFQQKKVDATAVIYVINYEGARKNVSGSNNEPEDNEDNLEIPPDTPNVQGRHDGSPTDSFQLPPDLHFENQGRQIQFQSSQPYIEHQGLTTAITSTTANQFLHHSPFHFPTSSNDMQPIHHPGQSYVNAQNSFSGWLPAFNHNMFAPDYSGVNHQQMAYPAYSVCAAPPAHEVPSAHKLPKRTAPNSTW